jgi:hypothetical protein
MSVFRDLAVTCPACGHIANHSVAESINAGNRAELRQQILDDTFQRFPCEACSAVIVVDGPLLLFDLKRHHWLELFPAGWEGAWKALELETVRRFQQTVEELAPPVIQDQADEFVVRTVFGIDALREKLVALDAGVDDRALEAAKLGLLRDDPRLIGDPDIRIRLRTATSDALSLAVLHRGRRRGQLELPRSDLDTTSTEAWQPTRDAIGSGTFVDANRLLVAGDLPRPA